MQFWNEIINTAMLGTEKKQVTVEGLPLGLREAATGIANRGEGDKVGTGNDEADKRTGDKEEQFLQLAAVALNFRRSGMMPLHKEGVSLPAAAAEILPYCSALALRTLKDMLAEDNPFLLAAWLRRCASAHRLVGPDLIPLLLNKAVNHKSLQPDSIAVCGKRGEWLSRFHSSWQFLADEDDETIWQTGTAEQRKNLIRRLRLSGRGNFANSADYAGSVDSANRAKAREWLIKCWPQENANTKTELLKQLHGTLTAEDNEWLTELLNEKSQKVKDEALHLLKELQGSPIVEKYWEMVRQAVTLKKEKALLGMVSRISLQLHLPVLADESIFKSGIEKLSSDKAFTDDEFILSQLIRFVPPAYWESHLSSSSEGSATRPVTTPPETIIGYFQKEQAKFLPALMHATLQFRDARWALALIGHEELFQIDLIALLPAQQQERYCLQYFGKHPESVIQYARQQDGLWSLNLARAIFKHTAKNPYQYSISFYKENIQRIPPAMAAELERCSPGEAHLQTMWSNTSEQIITLIGLIEQTNSAFS